MKVCFEDFNVALKFQCFCCNMNTKNRGAKAGNPIRSSK
jgi:hypothetical protein